MISVRIDKSKRCNGDYSLFVSFPYKIELVEMLRSFPIRYWDKDNKVWEVPTNKLQHIIDTCGKDNVSVIGELPTTEANPVIDTSALNFKFKTKPLKHQIDGFKYGLSHDKWLLGDEQGLGKTKQVIDIAVAKKQLNNYTHCLIICGVNGLKWNWKDEVAKHSNETSWILGQRTRKSGKLTIGSNADKLQDLYNLNDIKDYFIITNVESLRDVGITAKITEYCNVGIINMIAVDEIHKCKNPSSLQSKGLLKLKPGYRVAMSGTPLMNSPLDLYIVLRWLGYEKHAYYAFKNHHCVMGGYGGYEVIGYCHMEEIAEATNLLMLRRLKEDVLDLPEKIYINEYVDMSLKQSQVYKEVSAEIKANIDKIKMSNNPLAELIRMRQATGYTGILSSTIQESAKIDRLEEIVEESNANNRKVVIFSNWTQMTTPIHNRLHKNYRGILITGDTTDEDRQANVNEFQTDPDCRYALGTIGAMGTGITLTAGTVVVFMDEPWTMANKQQAIDRCHRIGTTSNITIYTIMCKNTIDERIHDIVEKKGLLADAILDNKLVGNKTELLNYLLS